MVLIDRRLAIVYCSRAYIYILAIRAEICEGRTHKLEPSYIRKARLAAVTLICITVVDKGKLQSKYTGLTVFSEHTYISLLIGKVLFKQEIKKQITYLGM